MLSKFVSRVTTALPKNTTTTAIRGSRSRKVGGGMTLPRSTAMSSTMVKGNGLFSGAQHRHQQFNIMAQAQVPFHVESLNSQASKNKALSESDFIGFSSPEEMLQSHLKDGKVLLWTKGEHCSRTGRQTAMAKELLDKHEIEYDEICISHGSQKVQNEVVAALALDTGYMNFPNIYFGEFHVGGLEDLKSHMQCQRAQERLKESLCSSSEDNGNLEARAGKTHFDSIRAHRYI